jgi:hypothetical protein
VTAPKVAALPERLTIADDGGDVVICHETEATEHPDAYVYAATRIEAVTFAAELVRRYNAHGALAHEAAEMKRAAREACEVNDALGRINADLLEACKVLADQVHDDVPHAYERVHAALGAVQDAIAKAGAK